MKKETFAFDLDEIFVRVSQTYFGGKIARPKLAWSARGAKYTMGKYNYTTDTLTINRRLNRADTPEYVLEFVMYHELLHKALGYSVVNNRRRVIEQNFIIRVRDKAIMLIFGDINSNKDHSVTPFNNRFRYCMEPQGSLQL